MACTHVEGCPLFPLLNASLRGWRNYYCDTVDSWRGCARYKMSLTGQPVPINLLPNGAVAQHLERFTQPRQAPTPPPPPYSPQVPQQPAAPQAQLPKDRKRRWWSRLIDWMAGPA
ncbi:MAG TPA: hypothetical protein VGD43_00850 [Micromonospora sp.]